MPPAQQLDAPEFQEASETVQQQADLPLLIHVHILPTTVPSTSPWATLLLELPNPAPNPRKQHPHTMQLSLDIPVARDQVLLDPIQACPAPTTSSRRRRGSGGGIRAKGLQ